MAPILEESAWVEALLPLEGPHLAEYERLLRTEEYGMALKVGKTSFEKGQEYGQLRIVLFQLQKRFGLLTEAVKARVEHLSQEQLDELAAALLTPASLRELGLDEEASRADQ